MSDTALKERPTNSNWLAALILFGPLAILAEFLISRTHHRPLGAATFATVTVFVWIVTEASLRRFLDSNLGGDLSRRSKVAWGIGTALTAVFLIRAFL